MTGGSSTAPLASATETLPTASRTVTLNVTALAIVFPSKNSRPLPAEADARESSFFWSPHA